MNPRDIKSGASHKPGKHSGCVFQHPQLCHGFHAVGMNRRYVAYLKSDTQAGIERQRALIHSYCRANDCCVAEEYIELKHRPAMVLESAIASLKRADGLLVADLNVLVQHEHDRARELRPLLHHFMHEGGKHLLSVSEGIDTSTTAGQAATVEYINGLKDQGEELEWYR